MDKDEIRKTWKAITAEIESHQTELTKLMLDLKFLQANCKHPSKHKRNIIGKEFLWQCPDCGWQRIE